MKNTETKSAIILALYTLETQAKAMSHGDYLKTRYRLLKGLKAYEIEEKEYADVLESLKRSLKLNVTIMDESEELKDENKRLKEQNKKLQELVQYQGDRITILKEEIEGLCREL